MSAVPYGGEDHENLPGNVKIKRAGFTTVGCCHCGFTENLTLRHGSFYCAPCDPERSQQR